MRVYIAGPISGYPDGNRPAFLWAADTLRRLGHLPVNPHDIDPLDHADGGPCKGEVVAHSYHKYGCFLVPDIRELLACDGYTLLEGWRRSKGATVEDAVARICGLTYIDTEA